MRSASGAADIEDVYSRRRLAPKAFVAPALTLLIAPGEERFWRGLVNGYLAQELVPVRGNALGAVILGGATSSPATSRRWARPASQGLLEPGSVRRADGVADRQPHRLGRCIFLVQPAVELPTGT